MTAGRALMLVVAVLLGGCDADGQAPPTLSTSSEPEVLFLVRNEVWSIRLDGTNRRSLGTVGDDRHRTGYPRFLPDGRVAVLGDETGGIFPYVGPATGGDFRRLPDMNVTFNDSLCGVRAAGRSYVVFTATPFTPFFPTSARLYRIDPDDPQLEAVGFQQQGPDSDPGAITEPAPYDDGRVLAVRTVRPDAMTPGVSSIELMRVDVAFDHDPTRTSEKLVTLADGLLAHAPARLPDGRVVFIKVNPNDPSVAGLGEMMIIDAANTVRSTGIIGAVALEVVGDRIIYESGGADGIADLVMTDLVHPPVNLTNTSFVSEHLAWSN